MTSPLQRQDAAILESLARLIDAARAGSPPAAADRLTALHRLALALLDSAARGTPTPVGTYLDASLDHITVETSDLLAAGGGPHLVACGFDSGYWVYAHDPLTLTGKLIPKDLYALIAAARDRGCDWIKIDEGGCQIPSLATYDPPSAHTGDRTPAPPWADVYDRSVPLFSAPRPIARLFISLVALARSIRASAPEPTLDEQTRDHLVMLEDIEAQFASLGMGALTPAEHLTLAPPDDHATADPLPVFEVGVRGIVQLTHTMRISAPDRAAAEASARRWLETDAARAALLSDIAGADVDDRQVEFIDTATVPPAPDHGGSGHPDRL